MYGNVTAASTGVAAGAVGTGATHAAGAWFSVGTLPYTGLHVAALVFAAVTLLFVGSALVQLARRRPVRPVDLVRACTDHPTHAGHTRSSAVSIRFPDRTGQD